jgi:hypothetical protein
MNFTSSGEDEMSAVLVVRGKMGFILDVIKSIRVWGNML